MGYAIRNKTLRDKSRLGLNIGIDLGCDEFADNPRDDFSSCDCTFVGKTQAADYGAGSIDTLLDNDFWLGSIDTIAANYFSQQQMNIDAYTWQPVYAARPAPFEVALSTNISKDSELIGFIYTTADDYSQTTIKQELEVMQDYASGNTYQAEFFDTVTNESLLIVGNILRDNMADDLSNYLDCLENELI